jgi:hypothetical protein
MSYVECPEPSPPGHPLGPPKPLEPPAPEPPEPGQPTRYSQDKTVSIPILLIVWGILFVLMAIYLIQMKNVSSNPILLIGSFGVVGLWILICKLVVRMLGGKD